MADPQLPAMPPMPALPGAGLQSIEECNQYWDQFQAKRGELPGLAGQDLVVAKKDARTFFRKYNRCIYEKRGPLALRRTINTSTEAEIEWHLAAGNGPLEGGRRRHRRSNRSRRSRRIPKRGQTRKNTRK